MQSNHKYIAHEYRNLLVAFMAEMLMLFKFDEKLNFLYTVAANDNESAASTLMKEQVTILLNANCWIKLIILLMNARASNQITNTLPMNMLDGSMLFKFDQRLNFTYIVAANDNESVTSTQMKELVIILLNVNCWIKLIADHIRLKNYLCCIFLASSMQCRQLQSSSKGLHF